MSKIKKELLIGRGFKDEKHLFEFLETCNDESWKTELKNYFGLKTEEVIEDETEEVESEEIIDETPEVEDEVAEEVIEDETEEVEEKIEEE